jgi:hypothetical protein
MDGRASTPAMAVVTSKPLNPAVSSEALVLIGLGWLAIATGVGAVGIVSALRPPRRL